MKKRRVLTILAAGLIAVLFIALTTTIAYAVISDGSHGGNPHFYFLSPIFKNVSYSGEPDFSLDPVVEICPWDAIMRRCGVPIATFTTTSDLGDETIRISEDGNYIVNWHTGDVIDEDHTVYRINVYAGGARLGFADVMLVNNGKEARNVDGDVIPLNDNRTLPIRFRIEEGALGN